MKVSETVKVDAARLDAGRSNVKYDLLSGMTTPARVASSMARLVALTGDVTVVDEGDDLPAVLQAAGTKTEPGVDLVIVRIDPDHDMAVRRSITTAVGEAING